MTLRRWYTFTHLDSSLSNLIAYFFERGIWGLWELWPRPSAEAWVILLVFGSLQAGLQLGMPGRQHIGPTTPKGNKPVYKVTLGFRTFHSLGLNKSDGRSILYLSKVALPCLW